MKSDSPIVEEVRRRRMAISARFDHDLEKYAAHLKEIQRQHHERVVNQLTVIRAPSTAEPAKS
jgi:phosphoserine phosphatase